MPITLRLTLAPERETVTFEDNATIQDLFQTACNKFGLTACSLKSGFPPVSLELQGKESMTLLEAGIKSQQSLVVVPSTVEKKVAVVVSSENGRGNHSTSASVVAAASATNQNNNNTKPRNKSCIPGLTKGHYIKRSQQTATETPTRLPGNNDINPYTGKFDIQWKAPGSNGASYMVSATGNLLAKQQPQSLQVKCTCPAFAKLGKAAAGGKVRVCKHLEAALDSMIDPQYVDQEESSKAAKKPQNNNNVVELLSDSSSDDDNEMAVKKRAFHKAIARPNNNNKKEIKKRRVVVGSNNNCPAIREEAPIKLLATPQDMQLRQQHANDYSHGCWDQCKTLREVLFGNDAVSSIQWMVVANFLMDFDDLSNVLPEMLTTIPRVTIFYGGGQSPTHWPKSVDFQVLNPAAEPQTDANPLRYRFEYGSHHTKMFMVGFANKIRVVVSTSNQSANDRCKAQAVYVEDFPIKSQSELETTTSDYEETLIYYMRSYGYHKKFHWMGNTSNKETLVETLARYDYSQAKGVLIPSIPGYHNIDSKTPCVGQLKLRQAIQQYTRPYNNNSNNSTTRQQRPVVCQFSSIGSTSEKYLHTLQTSMDMCLARTGETSRGPLRLQLVWPTADEIRNSMEGYMGGGSAPGYLKNVSKPFLRPLWRKWSGNSTGANSNPLAKPYNVPHIKSYYQTNDTNDGFGWLCITSHNISQAAWGTINKNNKNFGGGERLFVRSWELGVFVSPETLGVDKLVPWTTTGSFGGPGRTLQGGASSGNTTKIATVPMPYHSHGLQPYSENDEPWAVNQTYALPDRFGRRSCQG